jgi:tetratricopeptide (TPR) repeat protein
MLELELTQGKNKNQNIQIKHSLTGLLCNAINSIETSEANTYFHATQSPLLMKKQEDSPQKQDLEAEVWGAISAFEQILEALPTDRASLEALWNAYEQIGDFAKARAYLFRLGNVIVEEEDIEVARLLLEKVRPHAADDESARELLGRMERLVERQKPPTVSSVTDGAASDAGSRQHVKTPTTEHVRTTFSMADELAFAWNLLEANQLTQEEYASVVQDLTEMSAVESATTVSVLHVLENRAFKNIEKIMAYVSKECGTPIISLASFDFKPDEATPMSMDFMMGRGAFVFETIGKDALVVVMNPYDKQLKKDVETLTGRKCHFFMSLPSEFDKALANLKATRGA